MDKTQQAHAEQIAAVLKRLFPRMCYTPQSYLSAPFDTPLVWITSEDIAKAFFDDGEGRNLLLRTSHQMIESGVFPLAASFLLPPTYGAVSFLLPPTYNQVLTLLVDGLILATQWQQQKAKEDFVEEVALSILTWIN